MKPVAQAVLFTFSILCGCLAAFMWIALSAPDLTQATSDSRTHLAQAFGAMAVVIFTLAWSMGDL